MEQSDNIQSQQHDIAENGRTMAIASAADMGAGHVGAASLVRADGRSSHDVVPANAIGRDEEMIAA